MMECQKQNFNWKAWKMQQMRLPVGQEIVRDPVVIKQYLMLCMRILKGEKHG
jgi:hypothetical protein